MNKPRMSAEQYIQFLIASPTAYSATEAARVQPEGKNAAAHDSINRMLNRLPCDSQPLWDEVRPHVVLNSGMLILDDSTLDKPYAKHIGLVGSMWSGKHKRVVRGIGLLTLLHTTGDALWPCDYRVVDPAERLTKNDLFRQLLDEAKKRGFEPEYVVFDSWYGSLENLKAIRKHQWKWLTQLKSNRLVDIDRAGYKAVSEQQISSSGTLVHVKGYGTVKVFRVVAKNGHTEHWATNDLEMDELTRLRGSELSWGIEEYHRGLKQHTGIEKCQMRLRRAQRNHIGFAIRAFVRLEYQRVVKGLNWFAAKTEIVRAAVRAYLAAPTYNLPPPSTA
jgi:hypothetical protein